MRLLEPLGLGSVVAPNRVMFGPHVTNLADDERRISVRHVAYYRRRAVGGCGLVVTEGASVHESDWPYERAPDASRCADGWGAVAAAVHEHGTLAIASLDHAGGQGSSAYSQRELWAPSRVPEVTTREVPKWMEDDDIAAVVTGFGAAARIAVDAGCDGVEINAGQHSLVRQFLSGLTNNRIDRWGVAGPGSTGRTQFAHDVIAAARAAIGDARVLGLRLSCDELAPWAGITPDSALAIAAELTAGTVDYLVVTRGSIFSAEQTRPDFHQPPAFNRELARAVAAAVTVPVFAQGSIVDVDDAVWMVDPDRGGCAGVEMTRAQIAEPDLVAKLRRGERDRIRPCTRCNQTCQVRDVRNPIVTCVGEPTSGRETEDPDWYAAAATPRRVAIVGGGVAGLELARVAAARGHTVQLVEGSDRLGGIAAVAGPHGSLVHWLESSVLAEPRASVVRGSVVDDAATLDVDVVVQCTGGQRGVAEYALGEGVREHGGYTDIATLRLGSTTLPAAGDVVLFDPIGGPIAVALAEELGGRAILVTPDHVAGNELARTGDLAPANTRLARSGVRVERRSVVRAIRFAPAPGEGSASTEADHGPGSLEVELADRFAEGTRTIRCAAFVDCGFRLPTDPLPGADAQAGDCVAPRTVYEAILEARRVAHAL